MHYGFGGVCFCYRYRPHIFYPCIYIIFMYTSKLKTHHPLRHAACLNLLHLGFLSSSETGAAVTSTPRSNLFLKSLITYAFKSSTPFLGPTLLSRPSSLIVLSITLGTAELILNSKDWLLCSALRLCLQFSKNTSTVTLYFERKRHLELWLSG